MNWYRLLKLAFSRTKSQRLTMSLSRQIFDVVKNSLGKDSGTSFRVDDQCSLFLRINYVGETQLVNRTFYIEAFGFYSQNRSLTPPSIQFNISINKDFSRFDFPRFYYILYRSVRHELRHYWQYLDPNYVLVDNTPIFNEDLMTQYESLQDYILSPQEIEPFVSGLVFSAQKQRRPFDIILDENLNELFFENKDATKQDVLSSAMGRDVECIIENIKSQVVSRARQMYPQTKI